MNKKNRYPPLLRSIALVLVISFSLSEMAHAAPDLTRTLQDLLHNPSILRLPQSFAHIHEVHVEPTAKHVLIHIQDAHTNSGAQENLSKIIEELINKYHVKKFFVEGGTKDDSLTFLRPLGDAAARRRVAKKYLMNGEINGAEYLSLVSNLDFELWGVEDKTLYDQSLKNYAAIVKSRESILSYLSEIQQRVQILKRRMYSKEALSFDEFAESYEKKQNDFTDYYARITEEAGRSGVNLLGYPQFLSLKALKAQEAEINFAKANEELRIAANSSEIAAPLQYQSHAPVHFYESLLAGAKAQGMEISQFRNLSKYLDYLKLYGSVNMTELIAEIESIQKQIYKTQLDNEEAAYLYDVSEHLKNLKSLFALQISKESFDAYAEKKGDVRFETLVMLAFLNKKLYEFGNLSDIIRFLPLIDDHKKEVEDFYQTTLERDKIFIEKASEKFRKENIPVAALITGGYHTPNLTRLMKDAHFSYVVVSPLIERETNVKRYEELLLGQLGEENPLKNQKVSSRRADALDLFRAVERPNGPVPVIAARLADSDQKILVKGEGSRVNGKTQKILANGQGSRVNGKTKGERNEVSVRRSGSLAIGNGFLRTNLQNNQWFSEIREIWNYLTSPKSFSFNRLEYRGRKRPISQQGIQTISLHGAWIFVRSKYVDFVSQTTRLLKRQGLSRTNRSVISDHGKTEWFDQLLKKGLINFLSPFAINPSPFTLHPSPTGGARLSTLLRSRQAGGMTARDTRLILSNILRKYYSMDPKKANDLSKQIKKTIATIDRDRTIYLTRNKKRLVEESALGTLRFFDLNSRWILTIDPFGNKIDELKWDSQNRFEKAWTLNGDKSGLTFKAAPDGLVKSVIAEGFDARPIYNFDPGIDMTNVQNIPVAWPALRPGKIAHGKRVPSHGVAGSVLRMMAYLAQDQQNDLIYVGNQKSGILIPDDPLFNALLEISDGTNIKKNTYRVNGMTIKDFHRLYSSLGPDYMELSPERLVFRIDAPRIHWKPSPPEKIFNPNGIFVSCIRQLWTGRADFQSPSGNNTQPH